MKKEDDYEVTSDNVFADLGLKKSDELMTRAKLLFEVSSLIKASNLTQKEIAKKLGITQPKVSLLISGKLSAFSADTLMHYLSLLGCNIEIHVRKPKSKIGISRRKGKVAVH